MNETEPAYTELRFDLRSGWVPAGPNDPETGIRQPTLWGSSDPSGGGDPTCSRPGHRYSHCDCGPYSEEPVHGPACDCADRDGGAWEDGGGAACDWAVHSDDCDGVHSNRPYNLYDPGHPGQLNDSP